MVEIVSFANSNLGWACLRENVPNEIPNRLTIDERHWLSNNATAQERIITILTKPKQRPVARAFAIRHGCLRNINKRRTTRRIRRRSVSVRIASPRLRTGIDRLTVDIAIDHVSRIVRARSVRYERASVYERLRWIEARPCRITRASERDSKSLIGIQLRILDVRWRIVNRCGVDRLRTGSIGIDGSRGIR